MWRECSAVRRRLSDVAGARLPRVACETRGADLFVVSGRPSKRPSGVFAPSHPPGYPLSGVKGSPNRGPSPQGRGPALLVDGVRPV